MKEKDQAIHLAQILYDRKARDITALDVHHLTVLTDYLVIASGNNALQVKALAEHVDAKAAEMGLEMRRQEGQQEGRWIVMDFNTIIVHIFHQEDRDYYRLDHLWSDGTNRLSLPFEEEARETLA
jgi:ribosome-associated protein